MNEVVTQYLPEAFAFIYVINSANAGGVQRDRVSTIPVHFVSVLFASLFSPNPAVRYS